jgi:hypothetical protein
MNYNKFIGYIALTLAIVLLTRMPANDIVYTPDNWATFALGLVNLLIGSANLAKED